MNGMQGLDPSGQSHESKIFSQICPEKPMSTPSTPRNPPINNKTKEKNLSCEWHSRYTPHGKIEVAEINQARSPATNVGLLHVYSVPSNPKSSHLRPK